MKEHFYIDTYPNAIEQAILDILKNQKNIFIELEKISERLDKVSDFIYYVVDDTKDIKEDIEDIRYNFREQIDSIMSNL